MKNKIIDAMNDISDNYIAEAHEPVKKRGFASYWPKLIVALSCVCLIVLILPNALRMGRKESAAAGNPAYYSADSNDYYYNGGYAAMNESAPADPANGKMDMASNIGLASDRKLIVNGSMNITTLEFDRVVSELNELIKDYDAYVQSASISSRNNSSRYYDMTIRIPSEYYREFVESLKGSGNVSYYSEEVDDITDVYSDINARLTSLRAEEARIMEFYKDASNIAELMEIEERLTDIRYEIDSLDTRLKNYDVKINYSTLTLSIVETKVYAKDNDSFLSRIANSFTEGWMDFTYFLEDIALFFTYNVFTIVLLAVLGYTGYRVYKKRSHK